MIVCNRCGKENQDHYKFCLGCGAELTAAPKAGGDVAMMKTMMADASGMPPMAPRPGGPVPGLGGPPPGFPPPGIGGPPPGFPPPGIGGPPPGLGGPPPGIGGPGGSSP